ncbi:ABC transporter ATP-binding protein [Brevibacillus fulvus]|uniref:Oligopeptide/dipeptide ABC transporter ATP-binding protein n=1 Tax=Brevibacillus fulvus TaxID=1125967 RepID=A0A938XYI8_9BACL|nr:oligopeptide/dipeptide ABC transporter ATP-binding protein [Brevibacillus fulvus]MBM7589259.1 oligopeptide/dipeptide ABC transporter ATP-binding protein [Brevibacillus fulvus]
MERQRLLEVKHLQKHFNVGRNLILKAADDVSFHIYRGETFGLVGESGCGKSTTGRTIIGLYQPTAGEVLFAGVNVHSAAGKQKQQLTRNMQMIFQDPYASLNPRMSVAEIIAEGMYLNGLYTGKERTKRVHELLEMVGLQAEHASRFPHEFSGGQRQRIGIARALAVNPEFVIADEPISALDVSVQAQVVNLLKQLQKEKQLTYLFIAHDLAMVKHISDRIGVMYLGNLVELTTSEKLYQAPKHPYTEALLSAIPVPDPDLEQSRERIILEGDVPSPISPPSGCVFRTRCPVAKEICAREKPSWQEIEQEHFVACHLYQ